MEHLFTFFDGKDDESSKHWPLPIGTKKGPLCPIKHFFQSQTDAMMHQNIFVAFFREPYFVPFNSFLAV